MNSSHLLTAANNIVASCSSDTALSSSSYSVDFTQGSSDDWTVTAGSITYTDNGAEFTITESGDAPTIQSSFYIFFGQVSFIMRAASGTGIVSSAILESDDLDEIDWEWLGGSVDEVETNYFGKGNTTTYDRAIYYDVSDTQTTTHNYTILWTSSYTTWYVDGTAVRTLNYADALDGQNYPQTPMNIRIGVWAGGDSGNSEGTIDWAGGETDYDDGPFTMYLEKVEVLNFSPGTSYTYGDTSGDWTSIEVEDGETNSAEGSTSTSSTSTSSGSSSSSSGSTSSGSSTSASKTTNTQSSSTTASMWWTASASAVIAASQSDASCLAAGLLLAYVPFLAMLAFVF